MRNSDYDRPVIEIGQKWTTRQEYSSPSMIEDLRDRIKIIYTHIALRGNFIMYMFYFSSLLIACLSVSILNRPCCAEERQITATFMIPEQPVNTKEVGASAIAAMNDIITLKVTTPARPDPVNDSRWTVLSVNPMGSTIKSQHPKLDDLTTSGHFVFVCCTVENLTDEASVVPPIILIDNKDRRFSPIDLGRVRHYLPKDYNPIQADQIQPGLSKKICAVFELPKDVTPATIEIYPLRLAAFPNLILMRNLLGKVVRASSDDLNDLLAATSTPLQNALPEKPATVALKCARTVNAETTINRHVKSRTLGYNVELKLSGPKQKDITIKAYFIGENQRTKMAIADTQDKLVMLTSDKPLTVNMTSVPVNQNANLPESIELKGVIIQIWIDGTIHTAYTSQYAWKKYAEMPDLLTQLEYDQKRKK